MDASNAGAAKMYVCIFMGAAKIIFGQSNERDRLCPITDAEFEEFVSSIRRDTLCSLTI